MVLSFGASSTLARQVAAGAPADVVVTADAQSLEPAVAAGAVESPRVLARNRMAVLVAPGNPGRVAGLGDLGRPGLAVVLCAPEVPCGRLAAVVLHRGGVRVTPRSLEPSVRAVVARVTQGEADAGIVYVTDARAAGGSSEILPVAAEFNASTTYPAAVVRRSARLGAARAFVDFALSPEGQAAMAAAGFDPP